VIHRGIGSQKKWILDVTRHLHSLTRQPKEGDFGVKPPRLVNVSHDHQPIWPIRLRIIAL